MSDTRFAPHPGITCGSCHMTKAPYEFNLNSKRPNGRQYWCRRCQAAAAKLRTTKDTAHVVAKGNTVKAAPKQQVTYNIVLPKTKFCPRCKTDKTYDKYHKSSKSKTGCASYCIECTKQRDRERAVARRPGFFTRIIKFIFGTR